MQPISEACRLPKRLIHPLGNIQKHATLKQTVEKIIWPPMKSFKNEFRKVIEDKSNLIEEKWHEHFNI